MKTLLFFLITASAFSAHAILESYYGRPSQRGFVHTCTYRNTTHHTLDMKYVVFSLDPMSGDNHIQPVQKRIDRVVRPGDKIKASVEILGPYSVHTCHFLAR